MGREKDKSSLLLIFLKLGKKKKRKKIKKCPCATASQHLLLKTLSVGAKGQKAGDSPQLVTDGCELSVQAWWLGKCGVTACTWGKMCINAHGGGGSPPTNLWLQGPSAGFIPLSHANEAERLKRKSNNYSFVLA